jgi:cell wall-associated NlpC family hydrolase
VHPAGDTALSPSGDDRPDAARRHAPQVAAVRRLASRAARPRRLVGGVRRRAVARGVLRTAVRGHARLPPSRMSPRRSTTSACRRPRLARTAALVAVIAGAPLLALAGCTARVAGVPISVPAPDGWPGRGRAPRRADPAPTGRSAPGGTAAAGRVLARADRYVGTRYRWGGTSPTTGFDCSGYVQYVYGHEGVRLPRTSRQQATAGTARPTRWDAAGPGDLVMFAERGAAISHVAFYVGRGRILHASASGGGVRYDDLDTRRGRWYRERLVAVRRVGGTRGPAIARGLLEAMGLTDAPLDPPDGAPPPR